jgi:hypothetical protein
MMHARQFAQTPDTSGWAYGLWDDDRDGHRALLHNGGGKGYRALMYLLPQEDAGFFLAYNLADRHADGELQEAFITEIRRRYLPPQAPAMLACTDCPIENVAGDYLYVRRSRTTVEKMIAVVNQVRVTRDETGSIALSGPSLPRTALIPVGPGLLRRADNRGVVAVHRPSSGASCLVLITESGFPAVYERIPLHATVRVQLVWLLGMVVVFLYASAWRPLAAAIGRKRSAGWEITRWSMWLAGSASALNLLFLAGFPLAFIGRLEGGIPQFVYGVPVAAAYLLLIPPCTAILTLAAIIALAAMWRNARVSLKVRIEHSVVGLALIALIAFAWYWRLTPAGFRSAGL